MYARCLLDESFANRICAAEIFARILQNFKRDNDVFCFEFNFKARPCACFIAQLLAFFIDADIFGRFTGADTIGLAFGHFGFIVFFPI
ncbi:hypothetical protein JY50_06570 [Neisseria meningitidis]|nr:hypothetical protein JY50_06570 [Neisseria meningitidis]